MLIHALIGRKLGDYMIVESLGQGGMAHVYKGYDANLDRYAAVKVISQNTVAGDDEQEYRERFQREARSIARLNHPHIVGIYQFGQTDDHLYYMAMKFIDGQDLRQILKDHLKRGKRLTTKFILQILRDIADALDYSHTQGVIHRDVKPSNIMVTPEGHAVLTDFGLALSTSEGTLGNTFGSVHYIAPEQAVSSKQASPQSDLYSLGVVLYELLSGKVPFDDSSAMSVALKHISDPPPPPSQFNPEISPQLEEVLMKMLDKDPRRRYETGAAFVKAIELAFAVNPNQDTEEMEDKNPPPTTTHVVVVEEKPREVAKPITPQPIKAPNLQVAALAAIQEAETITDSSRSSRMRDSIMLVQRRTRQRTALLVGGVVLALLVAGFMLLAANMNAQPPVTSTDVPEVALNDETQEAAVEIEATHTSLPTPTSTALLPTETPEATATHTATATRTPTITMTRTVVPSTATPQLEAEEGEGEILLRYDGRTLVIYNRAVKTQVDVSDLQFVRVLANGAEVSFNSNRWGTVNDNLYGLRPGDCFQVWSQDFTWLGSDEFPADICQYRQGYVQTDEVFWISPFSAARFEIQQNGRTLAECPAVAAASDEDTRCIVDIP